MVREIIWSLITLDWILLNPSLEWTGYYILCRPSVPIGQIEDIEKKGGAAVGLRFRHHGEDRLPSGGRSCPS